MGLFAVFVYLFSLLSVALFWLLFFGIGWSQHNSKTGEVLRVFNYEYLGSAWPRRACAAHAARSRLFAQACSSG